MNNYKVQVGGYVTVYREEIIIITAESERDAKDQAVDEFVRIQNESEHSAVCEDGLINSIKKMSV